MDTDTRIARPIIVNTDERMASPGPGVYVTSTRIGNAMYRGFTKIVDNMGAASVICYIPEINGNLHGTEIEIFFYHIISSDGVKEACL